MDTRETVIQKISDQKGIDKASIKLENTFSELGLDSLDMVELSLDLEQSLGITISHTDIEKIKTVGEAIDFVEKNKK
jgi:acyl carrier protein